MPVNPWDDEPTDRSGQPGRPGDPDDRPSDPGAWDHAKKPKPGWGCAVAAIIGSLTLVVVVIIIVKFLASLFNPGDLSP